MPVHLAPAPVRADPAPLAAGRKAGAFTLTGWHVLGGLVAFFVTVASVNAFMMYSAFRTMPGLDAGRNGYDVSQRYNGEIRAAAAQDALGWKATAELSRGSASVQFLDRTGLPVEGLTVEVSLLHPTSRQLDRALALRPQGSGMHAATFEPLGAGAWDMVITASRDGVRLFHSRNRKQF